MQQLPLQRNGKKETLIVEAEDAYDAVEKAVSSIKK